MCDCRIERGITTEIQTTKHIPIIIVFELRMSDPIEEAVLKEYVIDALMRCKLCHVTAANQTTWEGHKQGKKLYSKRVA